MNKEDSISFNRYINNGPDDVVWKPIRTDEEKKLFLSLIANVEESLKSNSKKQKGDALEALMTFVYDRFECAVVYPNVLQGDNQIDHLIVFADGTTPTFIHNHIGLRIIGESKNHQKSIDVREVADLAELLRSKRARLGIFSSVKTFSRGKQNNFWQFAEGKRRKLALARNEYIIGFTLEEIKSLVHNNFYTLLRQKYFNLVDEINDDYIEYMDDSNKYPYHVRLYNALEQLWKNGIINEQTFEEGRTAIIKKYGPVDE
ncbi:hypothetical protein FOI68_09475 [Brevibacillus sp. LEMMJ03]|uniref:hypothetical protein n=1 Tax=Brevibacillus sp. LEMMJ03 TaxID=2595056 RepID=UPI00117E2D92|nr:hypothetical protein [Brevibacillus sp. LEMMJ03]TRY25957.1 hypothetical protein FOI68_09475 [Brevibacillus sp. LEMMJ03]